MWHSEERDMRFPFGEELRPVVQRDRRPKRVFVLGVYASAVHARWRRDGKVVCQALAVASEPRIFWGGNAQEARDIISRIDIPSQLGTLEPAGANLNGPSAKVLDENILATLGHDRDDAWLCDCLPEARLNPSQVKAIKRRYNPLIEEYGLNEVTVPMRPSVFCTQERAEQIAQELVDSQAKLLVLLGDIPIAQFLNRVADVPYASLREYCSEHPYGTKSLVCIDGEEFEILPLAHPRQIGALGSHSTHWHLAHSEWERDMRGGLIVR